MVLLIGLVSRVKLSGILSVHSAVVSRGAGPISCPNALLDNKDVSVQSQSGEEGARTAAHKTTDCIKRRGKRLSKQSGPQSRDRETECQGLI